MYTHSKYCTWWMFYFIYNIYIFTVYSSILYIQYSTYYILYDNNYYYFLFSITLLFVCLYIIRTCMIRKFFWNINEMKWNILMKINWKQIIPWITRCLWSNLKVGRSEHSYIHISIYLFIYLSIHPSIYRLYNLI